MPWTEITRRQYERDGMRYASDLRDEEWVLIEPLMPPPSPIGRPRTTELRAVVERDPVHGVHGLSVAAIAQGVSTLFDRSGLLL